MNLKKIVTIAALVIGFNAHSAQGQGTPFNLDSLKIPARVIETYESMAEASQSDSDFAALISVQPCLAYHIVHDMVYTNGSANTAYPSPAVAGSKSFKLSKSQLKAYNKSFNRAEQIMDEMDEFALRNECVDPNDKCCKHAALDSCIEKTSYFCEITGSVDNCTTASQNCP